MNKKISIICPVFNEAECIPIFIDRLRKTISKISIHYDFEIIFTDNASTDTTYEILKLISLNDKKISLLCLSRNFGYQKSLLAGLTYSTGDAVIFIDVDCEDPPELITNFIEFWDIGYDVVYGLRQERPEPKVIQLLRKIFYRVLKGIGDTPINLDMAEFSLLSKYACDVILSNKTSYPFLRNEIAFVGLNQKPVPYNRQVRVAGKTHYNLFRMMTFAIGGILTSSTFPLRISFYSLIPLILLNIIVAILNFLSYLNQALIYIFILV